MLGNKLVIVLDHGPPIAQPSVVLLPTVVGLPVVFQAMPLTVTVAPPLEVIFPPLVILLEVILEQVLVVTVGAHAAGAVATTAVEYDDEPVALVARTE